MIDQWLPSWRIKRGPAPFQSDDGDFSKSSTNAFSQAFFICVSLGKIPSFDFFDLPCSDTVSVFSGELYRRLYMPRVNLDPNTKALVISE